MQPDDPTSPSTSLALALSGKRIRVRPIKRPSLDHDSIRFPSAPSEDADPDWVSPFTLPPLPALKKTRGQAGLLRSPEERLHERNGSSAYYAAAWGSPYATPSPSRSPAPRSTRNRSLELSSPLVTRSSGGNSSAVTGRSRNYSLPSNDAITPDPFRLQQGSIDTESQRRNWLSESEGSDSEVERLIGKTPTKRAHSKREPVPRSKRDQVPPASGHQVQESVDTITPETFDGASSLQLKSEPHLLLSDTMEIDQSASQTSGDIEQSEKPLPNLPSDSIMDVHDETIQSRPTLPPTVQSFQRPKKKVPWKGKSCIIALPLTDRDAAGLPSLLTAQEIRDRIQYWIDLGYPIHGFTVGAWHDSYEYGGESRAIFPDPADMDAESKGARSTIRFPNQGEWDAWVEYLKEEKLRALGVTPSNSEAPASTQSPFSSNMSRVSSTYPSMTASPPLPTLSAASNRARGTNSPFSPLMNGSTVNMFPSKPQIPTPGSLHGYRQSVAIPNMSQRIGSPFDYPISQPGAFGSSMRSPVDQLGRRSFTPGHVQNMQSMGHILSPPIMDNVRQWSSNPQVEQIRRQQEVLARQQQHVQAQLVHHHRQMSMFPMASRPYDHQPHTPMESPRRQTPEIMHPTPRSHRHNLSAALEQGMSNEKPSNSEEYANQEDPTESKESTDVTQSQSKDENEDEDAQEDLPILPRPETLHELEDKAEIETNPSIAGTPLLLDDQNPFAKAQQSSMISSKPPAFERKGHAAKPSISKFNAQAKEFSPTSGFFGSNFSFSSATFAPGSHRNVQSVSQSQHHAKAPSLSTLNVAAPEFKPVFSNPGSEVQHVFGQSTTEDSQSSFAFTPKTPAFDPKSSTFSFTSATFNVDAPEFKPSGGSQSSINFTPEKNPDIENSIFGNVVIDPFSKVMRRSTASKAVPIVRPESRDQDVENNAAAASEYGPDGRPKAPVERQKRARRADDGGDQAPLFADSAPFQSFADSPSPVDPIPDSIDEPATHEEQIETQPDGDEVSQEVLEESLLELSDAPPESDTDDRAMSEASEAPEAVADEISVEVAQEEDLPEKTPAVSDTSLVDVEEATNTSLEKPAILSEKPEYTGPSTDVQTDSAPKDLQPEIPSLSATAAEFRPSLPLSQDSKPSFSPLAQPFVFKPAVTEFVPRSSTEPNFASLPTQPNKSAPIVEPTTASKPKKATGLMASRFAATPSPELETASSSLPQAKTLTDVDTLETGVQHIPANVSSPKPSNQSPDAAMIPSEHGEDFPTQQDILARFREEDYRSSSVVSGAGDMSLEEINAVMKQFEDNPDLGVIREDSPIESTPLIDMRMPHNFRSDAPSPSPQRLAQRYQPTASRAFGGLNLSGVHQLNYGSGDISDWNNDLSPRQQDKLEARANFFDEHVNDLVDNVLENRLGPIERTLQIIQQSLTSVASVSRNTHRHSTSTGKHGSDADADDEDDHNASEGVSHFRSRSPRRERKQEMLKAAIMEAMSAYQPAPTREPEESAAQINGALSEMKLLLEQATKQPVVDKDILQELSSEVRALSEQKQSTSAQDFEGLQKALRDIQDAVQHPATTDDQSDIKTILEDVIATHPRLRGQRVQQDHEGSEKLNLKIDGLESMLKAAERRAEGEAALRREAEDEIESISRRLREAEDNAAAEREASESAQRSLESFIKEKQAYHEVETDIEELNLKNDALEKTLDEYRKSGDQWRDEIREEQARNRDLSRALADIREQYEERMESRNLLRDQIERLQQRMRVAMQDVARDETEWRRREHELLSKNQLLQSALDHETHRRSRLELDADKLHKDHRESLQYKTKHDHGQQEVARLTTLVASLQEENRSHQDALYQAQRELSYVKEHKASEVANISARFQADLEHAKATVKSTHSETQDQLAYMKIQLADTQAELEAQKSKHNYAISHMVEAHNRSLEDADKRRDSEFQELQSKHQSTVRDVQEDHNRALRHIDEDRSRLLEQLREQLILSNDKVKHLEGKVVDLEERLDVTKSAARAAVEAATAKVVNLPTPASSVVASPPHRPSVSSASMPLAKGSDLPEKISPQALRETIMVLQDQLQNREQKIDKLEAELGAIDKEAPAKVKERDTEITMLRELLDVRLDDLQELIVALEKPDYDRGTVKDAAIRLKTQMKMEQQLKERAISASSLTNTLPTSITSGLANLTQSPRAMVAAAAWGNWRKVRDTGISAVTDFASNIGSQTPSRNSSSSSAFVGNMMTPPATNTSSKTPVQDGRAIKSPPPTMRPLAAAAAAKRADSPKTPRGSFEGARPLRAYNSQPRTLSGARRLSSQSNPRPGSSGSATKRVEPSSIKVEPPSTPIQMHTDSDFGDDVDDDASPLEGRARDFELDDSEQSDGPLLDHLPENDLDNVVEVIEEE